MATPPPVRPPPAGDDDTVELRDKPGCRTCTCFGATVYSRAMANAKRSPACVGLPRRTEATEVEPAALPPDVSPGGDFKFLCLGVGVYNERPASADAAGDPAAAPAPALLADDGVELPQCVGVQIIRAQAVAQAPATLAADAGAGAGPPDPRARTRPLADPRTRTGPLPDPGALSLAQLAERFDKAAIKVVKRMGENADVLADAAKKAVGAAADAVFGGGRGK